MKNIKFLKDLKDFLKASIFNIRFKNACKKANKYYKETGYKALVLMIGGKPIVKYRKVLKQEIKRKQWNCKLEILEKRALYKTY
jgi:hypothetical protein